MEVGISLHDVSIPSRRVGNRELHFPQVLMAYGFNPLKAGRKLLVGHNLKWDLRVSIPSRRVGNHCQHRTSGGAKVCFNPLKAGRKLAGPCVCWRKEPDFNPLKAGRKPFRRPQDEPLAVQVSIPSRRVGNRIGRVVLCRFLVGFNPLKAGRKLSYAADVQETYGFQSPQGGSETVDMRTPFVNEH